MVILIFCTLDIHFHHLTILQYIIHDKNVCMGVISIFLLTQNQLRKWHSFYIYKEYLSFFAIFLNLSKLLNCYFDIPLETLPIESPNYSNCYITYYFTS